MDESADGAGPGQGVNQWSSIYMKVFDAGTFTLGPAHNNGQNMYGVVVVPYPEKPIVTGARGDLLGFTFTILDGSATKVKADTLAVTLDGWQGEVVNIDHHHDNTRFGDLVFVRGDASSTSELVAGLVRALGLRPGPAAAADLYAGISFDSGHFRHDSTAAATFRTAAWLV